MHSRSLPLRLAATAAVMAAAGALATSPASAAAPASGPPNRPYVLTVSTNRAVTDTDHRYADVTVNLTKADGTPVPNAAVKVNEGLVFETWNPFGDPIDPFYRENYPLGILTTDANGQIYIPQVRVDHLTDSSLLASTHQVEFSALYDVDGDMRTWEDTYASDAYIDAETRSSTVSFHVDKTEVKDGDILTVDGKVSLPEGQQPWGTKVFLRTNSDSEYDLQSEAQSDGSFVLRAEVSSDDNEFVLLTAPLDFYTTGSQTDLPVTKTSLR